MATEATLKLGAFVTEAERKTAGHVVEQRSPIWSALTREWHWWVPGAVVAFMLASVLMSGWPEGLIPNFSYPFIYRGDGLSYSWMAQRAIEGWIFDNPRSGYPFGSDFRDYPGSDAGNMLLLKLFGRLGGGYAVALNLFFLLSFPAIVVASFAVLKAMRLVQPLALSASILFAFLPFHFFRLGHLFYVWYFVVPIFFYIAFLIFEGKTEFGSSKIKYWRLLLWSIGFWVLASFGVYYAVFGTIVIGVAGLARWARTDNARNMLFAGFAIAMIVVGVLLNTAPNLYNKLENGSNPEVAVRPRADAEIYGLKLIQMVLPRRDHRIKRLAEITDGYNATHPLINENLFAVLGTIGATGLFALGMLTVAGLAGRRIDHRFRLLATVVLALFSFGTIGGLGALFSETISTSIRGWNRISVFIAFGALVSFFLVLQMLIARFFAGARQWKVSVVLAFIITSVGLYDQTIPACASCNSENEQAYRNEKSFIQKIEASVPTGSAIFQLPYIPFPESAPLVDLGMYDPVAAFLHSKTLRWSFAGMKGRPGDLFYRSLAQEPIERQLEVVKRLGFAGILIDRRGYQDRAVSLITTLTSLLGHPPTLSQADGQAVFFRLEPSTDMNLSGLSPADIMQQAGYSADKLGPRYVVSFSQGIDFSRRGWPDFVKDASGFSNPEPWGRWSDANLAPFAQIIFQNPIPKKFTFILKAQSFGPNAGKNLRIKIGSREYIAPMQPGFFQITFPVNIGAESVDRIDIFPPSPASPEQLGISTDARKLGIGFVQLSLQE